MSRIIHRPRGHADFVQGWQQEAALRMLMNTSGSWTCGEARRADRLRRARPRSAFVGSIRCDRHHAERMEDDETLLFHRASRWSSSKDAPRCAARVDCNQQLVPHWARQDQFDQYEVKVDDLRADTGGLVDYIGHARILQGTYETLAALAAQQGWPSLAGQVCADGGDWRHGGAQPLAITMNEASALSSRSIRRRAKRRWKRATST